jgi:hypothetical protein
MSIVMDDRKEPLYGVVMDAGGKSGGSMSTFSMINWEKSASELSSLEYSSGKNIENVQSNSEIKQQSLFKIDEVDAFVVISDDHYIIL